MTALFLLLLGREDVVISKKLEQRTFPLQPKKGHFYCVPTVFRLFDRAVDIDSSLGYHQLHLVKPRFRGAPNEVGELAMRNYTVTLFLEELESRDLLSAGVLPVDPLLNLGHTPK